MGKKEDIVERLTGVIPHIKTAIDMAKAQAEISNGKVVLSVGAMRPDGSGKVVAHFDGEEFINDIEELVSIVGKKG